jgi:hypothetical protein
VEAEIILRPTVIHPVCLGVWHLSEAHYQLFITVGQFLLSWWGTSLWWEAFRQRNHSRVRIPQDSWPFMGKSKIWDSLNMEGQVPILYPQRIGQPSYNPRHSVPFSSSLMTGSVAPGVWHASAWEMCPVLHVKAILRPTVSQLVSLGVGPPSGAHDQFLVTAGHSRSSCFGAPSLREGNVCTYSSLSFSDPSPAELMSTLTVSFETIGFPLCGLLRLARLRWRYSNPPP